MLRQCTWACVAVILGCSWAVGQEPAGQQNQPTPSGQAEGRTLEQLDADLAALEQVMADLRTQMQEIIDTDAANNTYLRLDSTMRSEAGRQVLQRAVNESLQTTGTLTLVNKTSTGQSVTINNRDSLWIPAGAAPVQVQVPVGTVTVQVQGREMTTWTITAPTYSQSLDIVPANQGTLVWDPLLGAWVRQ